MIIWNLSLRFKSLKKLQKLVRKLINKDTKDWAFNIKSWKDSQQIQAYKDKPIK